MPKKIDKMKLVKYLFAAVLMLGFNWNLNAQDDGIDREDECRRYKAIAGNAYKSREYEKVVRSYNRALEYCGTLEMVFYNPFIYSINQARTNAPDEATEAAYIDTLIMIQERAQKEHGLQETWQTKMGYYYLKQGAPGNMKKADEAYQIGIHLDKENTNRGYLQQYYANMYNLWVQEKNEDVKEEYKKRLITEYFSLSDYVNKGDMGTNINDFLTAYLNRVVNDCDDLLPEINNFMQDLPENVEAKKATVNNFMSMVEEKGCTNSKEYEMLVDTIIAIDPSVDAVIAKAKLQLSKGDVSGAVSTFNDAKEMAADGDQKSDIEYDIARAYYNSGSYKSAHNAGISVSGKNAAKGYEIAAKSVNRLMNDCGASTFDRKANNYYAVELAEKSGNSSLISQMQKAAPTSRDIFQEGKSVGEQVTLNCWNKTYEIKTY